MSSVARTLSWVWKGMVYLILGKGPSKEWQLFRKNSGSTIEIDDILPQFLKVRLEDCPKFWIQTHWQERRGYHPKKYFFFDAHHSFILWTKNGDQDLPIACIAFDPFGNKGVCIYQIRGKSGRNEFMKYIKWERLLVAAVVQWAQLNQINKIHIISAFISDYYTRYRHESMYLRYDVTARRMGFKYNAYTKIYGANVSQLKFAAA